VIAKNLRRRPSGQDVTNADDAAAGTLIAGKRAEAFTSALLACPHCQADAMALSQTQGKLCCTSCKSEYPLICCGETSIPWLYPKPEAALLEWTARYRGFLQHNASEYNRLNRALATAHTSSKSWQRISATLNTLREHRQQVVSILQPIGFDSDDLVPPVTRVLNDKLPRNQGLSSYASNVFRDWAWENGENEALFDATETVLNADSRASVGAVLTLGAGACRLPYDIHRRCSPTLSIALDLNPLLLLIGSRIIQGEHLPLYEFPIAPLENHATGVLQECQAPARLRTSRGGNFQFVLGDATRPPFASNSFDTVVTPWFIDIIPQDLCVFVPQVNRLLAKDGVWVNTGSLNFSHEDPCRCYSEDEVLDIVEKHGFEILAVNHRKVPYLQSPHSAHGRVEQIVSFAAKKRFDATTPEPAPYLPDWLLDTSRPIPSSPDQVVTSSAHLLTAQVLSAIDGKRSIEAIGKLVSREYNLDVDECIHAITRILVDAYEDRNSAEYWGHS